MVEINLAPPACQPLSGKKTQVSDESCRGVQLAFLRPPLNHAHLGPRRNDTLQPETVFSQQLAVFRPRPLRAAGDDEPVQIEQLAEARAVARGNDAFHGEKSASRPNCFRQQRKIVSDWASSRA